MPLIEITQDGAGVLYCGKDDGDGFFTNGVETCIVYSIFGEAGMCLIHDTGQLSIPSIKNVVKECGAVERVFIAMNEPILRSSIKQYRSHVERYRRLFSVIKWPSAPAIINIVDGSVVIQKDGDLRAVSAVDEILALPQRDERNHINIINNLFSKPNSQSLDVDVQYIDGKFSHLPKVKWDISRMTKRAEEEVKRGDLDFKRCLESAQRKGLLT